MSELSLYFDGASKNNGQESGCGYYIEYKNEYSLKSYKDCKYLGHQTNNYAEYSGLILGLEFILSNEELKNASVIKVHGDSSLVINQMQLKWKVKSDNIKELFVKAQSLTKNLRNIEFIYIPREQNKIADTLANNAIVLKK